MKIAKSSAGSKREPLSPSTARKIPRNGCMIRSVARITHRTNGVVAGSNYREFLLPGIMVQTIAKP